MGHDSQWLISLFEMGKSGKERKRLKLLNAQSVPTLNDNTESDSEDETSCEIFTTDNLTTTVSVLDTLSSNITLFRSPELKAFRSTIGPLVTEQRGKHFERRHISETAAKVDDDSLSTSLLVLGALCTDLNTFRSKEFKGLRASLHPLVLELTGANKNKPTPNGNLPTGGFSGRISAHLIANEWLDALKELHKMYIAKQAPKLGALQRWVRDADLAPAELRFPLIDAVLRVVENVNIKSQYDQRTSESPVSDLTKHVNPVCKSLFVIPTVVEEYQRAWKEPLGHFEPVHIKIVHTQYAADRPSNTDLNMFTIPADSFCLDNSDLLSSSAVNIKSRSVSVPGVPGGFVIPHILSPQECDRWLSIAQTMKFAPDTVVGINHVLWLAQSRLIESVYERVKPHLPPTIDQCAVAGINARLRFFCYEPGAEYRVHVDGAWPGSGFNAEGVPVDDIFGDRYSRLTFLIYLNDDFEGGHTTFFTPSSSDIGLLEASAVKPSKGSILCFPHGDAVGSLAHEGTSVIRGLKYVIRTDVLYMLPAKSSESGVSQKRKIL